MLFMKYLMTINFVDMFKIEESSSNLEEMDDSIEAAVISLILHYIRKLGSCTSILDSARNANEQVKISREKLMRCNKRTISILNGDEPIKYNCHY